MGLDGLVGSETNNASATSTTGAFGCLASSDAASAEAKQKWYGSGFLKQERSATEDDWRCSKLPKTDDISSASKAMQLLHHRNSFLRSNTNFSDAQMLSFSSPKSDPPFPFSYHSISPFAARTTGTFLILGLLDCECCFFGVF